MIDKVEINVKAGDGGSGSVGFRREMYVPYGGPDGGDGGRGGDVIIRADRSVDNLRAYRGRTNYKAENGHNGAGRKKFGADGQNLVLTVPPGTIVTTIEDGQETLLADLENDGDNVIAAGGGKGGYGNVHYKSSVNQAPRIAQRGETGEERFLRLEMRLIADVGIIGYPNAGKSTLLAAASAAKPKIASYPFTTLEPVLGLVQVGEESFVIAEIPGLIEGAHLGKGLGHDFLRHAMRTRVLIHLVSGDSASPGDDMVKVNNELTLFDPVLGQKPQIVAVNKTDLPQVQEVLDIIKSDFTAAGIKPHYISAETGDGVKALMAAALKALNEQNALEKKPEPAVKVFRPQPREPRIRVEKENGEFVIYAPGMDRLIAGQGATANELRWQLNMQLEKHGVTKALEQAGVRLGDKIRCGSLTWEWSAGEKGIKRLGVLGGTFDPVHLGHLIMAEEVQKSLELDEVLIVPAGQPQTRSFDIVTPARQRLDMLELAVAGKKELKISTIETDRKGPSFTADTLLELKNKYGTTWEIYFILGWDSLAQLPTWHEPSRILNLCYLAAVPRPGYKRPSLKALEGVLPGISDRVVFMDGPKIDISATEVRERVAKGETITHLVPEAVAEYIRKHKLYTNQEP
jgi:GTPase